MANAVMIHNITHSDLLLALQCNDEEWTAQSKSRTQTVGVEKGLMGRPQYAMFQPITNKVLRGIKKQGSESLPASRTVTMDTADTTTKSLHTNSTSDSMRHSTDTEPRHRQSIGGASSTPHDAWRAASAQRENLSVLEEDMYMTDGTVSRVPIGLQLMGKPVEVQWKNFHLRPSVNKDALTSRQDVGVHAMYFPQIALSTPLWMSRCVGARKTILLICGEGNSRNPAHGSYENSTLGTAKLVKIFLEHLYPDAGLTVEIIHSEAEIFKMRDNVEFFLKELHPKLYEIRRDMARLYDEEWPDRFRVTVSLSDGPPARLNALMAALRQFRPDVAHMWQPKVFFHFGTLSEEDVEYHNFDLVDAQPPIAVDSPALSLPVKRMAQKMLAYKHRFLSIVEDGDSEINEFWLRKTKKPVLSVLRYTKPGEESQYVYGMNIEVSMPTGSLCSERNAIGTAIASDPSLKRKDFDMIAILSISLPELANASTPAVTPNPARRDRRSTELDTNQTDTNQTQTSLTTEHGMLKGSKGSAHTLANVLSDVAQNAGPTTTDGTKSAATSKPPGSQPLMNAVPPRGFYEDCLAPLKRFNSDLQALTIGNEEFIWPQEKKRTELNPLDPCGSCMEWLRKIAEVNPDMKIVTFDSSSCERLYVKNVIR